ncbi:MAG: hypothetical protein IPF81_17675 [Bacteroidetes bacterium]|nr:hypothetical protein [Bacteroidota bacterium]
MFAKAVGSPLSKQGNNGGGTRAVTSHTGFIGWSSDSAVGALFRKAGIG